MFLLFYIGSDFILNPFVTRYFIKLITFTMDRKSNVINLSRVAFEDLHMAKPTPKSSSRLVFIRGQDRPALCVCFASVAEDKLHEAEGNFPIKSLQAIMHQQEYELKVANLCHLLDVSFIRSQIDNNRWSFTTRPSNPPPSMEQSSLHFPGLFILYLFCFGWHLICKFSFIFSQPLRQPRLQKNLP
jgi:hypothetical protein